jgi:AcrR family transcriptional regulator
MSLHSQKGLASHQDQIAKATLRLVSEHGADQITITDVIKALGITRAAMARHCGAEDDLWRLTTEFIERRMVEPWEAVVSSDVAPTERLRSLLSVHLGLIIAMPALREFLFSRSLHRTNAALQTGLSRIRVRFSGLLGEVLRDGIRLGQLPPTLDTEKTARRIIETLQGMVVGWSLEAGTEDVLDEAWARVEALLKPE